MNTENIKFEIKKLTLNEISDFFKKHDNDYFERLSDRVDIEEYSQKIYQNAAHFTVFDNEKLVGLSPCYFNDETQRKGYISSLTINQNYRGFKLGSTLLNQIKDFATDQGIDYVFVSLNSKNKDCIDFYNKNKFYIDEQNDDIQSCSLKYTNTSN